MSWLRYSVFSVYQTAVFICLVKHKKVVLLRQEIGVGAGCITGGEPDARGSRITWIGKIWVREGHRGGVPEVRDLNLRGTNLWGS